MLHVLTPWGFLKVFPFSDVCGLLGITRGKCLCNSRSPFPAALRWYFSHPGKQEGAQLGPAILADSIKLVVFKVKAAGSQRGGKKYNSVLKRQLHINYFRVSSHFFSNAFLQFAKHWSIIYELLA